MSTLPQTFITAEEYVEAERKAAFRSEYADGRMFAMAGASPEHEEIVANLAWALRDQLRDGTCKVFGSNLKVQTSSTGPILYPDLTVVCGKPEFRNYGGLDVLLNPKLIVEVLSPSTESYDRGKKFEFYRHIASFTEYLLIVPDRPHVDHYVKRTDGLWEYSPVSGLDGVIELPAISAILKSSDIYPRGALESGPSS